MGRVHGGGLYVVFPIVIRSLDGAHVWATPPWSIYPGYLSHRRFDLPLFWMSSERGGHSQGWRHAEDP